MQAVLPVAAQSLAQTLHAAPGPNPASQSASFPQTAHAPPAAPQKLALPVVRKHAPPVPQGVPSVRQTS